MSMFRIPQPIDDAGEAALNAQTTYALSYSEFPRTCFTPLPVLALAIPRASMSELDSHRESLFHVTRFWAPNPPTVDACWNAWHDRKRFLVEQLAGRSP